MRPIVRCDRCGQPDPEWVTGDGMAYCFVCRDRQPERVYAVDGLTLEAQFTLTLLCIGDFSDRQLAELADFVDRERSARLRERAQGTTD